MRNTLLKFIFICLCGFYPVFALKAQSFVTRVEDYRDRYLWLQTANPAGLLFNAASSFSVAEARYRFTNGDNRIATEAASLQHFQVYTESYRRLKQIQLHGRFGYENSQQNDRQWQTTLQPEAHLINFGDTVAGRQTIETYNICVGAALPLGQGWQIGGSMDYYARTGRKHIDPRNQNDQVDLNIASGVLYRRAAFGIGAHFNYQRIVEKINYSIFNGETYDICTFYPLWFGLRESFQMNVNSSRSYREERFGGALQLWGKGRRYEWLSECRYVEGLEKCDISEITKSRVGETRRQELKWNGQVRIRGNVQHTFRPAYHRLVRTGYDHLQSLPEHSTEQSYLDHGRTKRSAIINDVLSLDYTLLSAPDSLSGYRKIKTRLEWQQEQTQFFVYPATFKQTIRHMAFSVNYTRQFLIRQHALEMMAEATYRHSDGYLPEIEAEEEYPLPEIKISQRNDLLRRDFEIKTAETLRYSAAIQYTRRLKGTYALFTRTTVSYLQGLSRPYRSEYRLHCGVSAGLLF